jgi:hypothetical protein
LIARQRGVRVRSFRSEAEALEWFKDRRAQADRRLNGERRRGDGPRQTVERRNVSVAERRRGERRGQSAS